MDMMSYFRANGSVKGISPQFVCPRESLGTRRAADVEMRELIAIHFPRAIRTAQGGAGDGSL
jgi:hypothetical protein